MAPRILSTPSTIGSACILARASTVAAAKAPGNQRAHNNLGVLFKRVEAHGDAIPHFERAIEIVEVALERYPQPIYVRRQIVHNAHVVADLERRGTVFVAFACLD